MMNNKNIFKFVGIATAIAAMCSNAFACHFHKNIKPANKNPEIIEPQPNQSSNDEQANNNNEKKNCVRVIEVQEDESDKIKDPNLPPVLKYATPYIIKEMCEPEEQNSSIILPMYAIPNSESNKSIENSKQLFKNKNPWN